VLVIMRRSHHQRVVTAGGWVVVSCSRNLDHDDTNSTEDHGAEGTGDGLATGRLGSNSRGGGSSG
jgi:hypothetical protein